MAGSYRPPVLRYRPSLNPPHTTMRLPVHTDEPGSGAFVMDVGVQVSATGSYRPPVARLPPPALPPQTIIWLPVQTPAWLDRASGAFVVEVSVHASLAGSYRPPVSR